MDLRVSYPSYCTASPCDGTTTTSCRETRGPALPRLAEEMVHLDFQDAADSRTWYRTVGSRHAAVSKLWKEKQQQAYRDLARLPSARDPVGSGEAVIICNGKVGSRARGVVAEAALGLVHKEDSQDGRDRGVHRSSRRPYLGARRRRSLLRRCDAITGCGDEPSSQRADGDAHGTIQGQGRKRRCCRALEVTGRSKKKKEFASELTESERARRDKMNEMAAAMLQDDPGISGCG
ncbi:hypothetical protein MBM_07288 [Drepanopeziza brunnea f. sp. 'multigermtubi' MB_m1]|uniref:Uncharacterized protein n=1 Tax=Marssonina brunnea f. sp. multigermtubi (strain MB_m1) TaxID=1072389 RepID=K1WQA9_MARBU|nr:uncharacterized protein MBM_07288 [Drepanopeziza brunnea f. sp. 'multigermtubi' MB_m1]EKD14567.1 hypothetical protein MBM_07288 [Drepanopeziza brunnea f. sp. 'multigermtubi' MB_m1]